MLPLLIGCMRNDEKAAMNDSTANPHAGNNEYHSKLNEDKNFTELQAQDFSEPAYTSQAPETAVSKLPLIAVYYFHPTARCETCINIEAYSKEAVNSWKMNYAGKVEWKALNIDEKENEQYMNKYSLQFSSLIISEQEEGKELKWKNLEDIWKLAGNKFEFISYLHNELNLFIK